MTVGLVGLGKMGSIHYRVLKELRDKGIIKKILVYDPINVCEDSVNVFKNDDCDCVVIATPTNTHVKYVTNFIRCGVPVFCEKPLSNNIDDVTDMLKFTSFDCKYSEPMLFIGYIERYNIMLQVLKLALQDVRDAPDDNLLYLEIVRAGKFIRETSNDSEIITDLGIHDLDQLFQLFENYTFLDGFILTENKKAVMSKSSFLTNDNVRCSLNLSWIDSEKRRTYTAYTLKKVITVNLLTHTINIFDRITGESLDTVLESEPAVVEMTAFIDFVKAKERNYPGIIDPIGLLAQGMAHEIIMYSEVI